MTVKPSVLVTKRLPSVAVNRLAEVCDVDLHDGAAFLTHDELVARVKGKQGLVALMPDQVNRAVLEAGTDLILKLCADPDTRRVLVENLIDEEVGPENHRELWLRFAEGLGLTREEVVSSEPKIGRAHV